MDILTPALLALVPIIIGVVEVFKGMGLPSKYAPSIAVLLGVVGSISLVDASVPTIVSGIVVGLSASGLYSGAKTTLAEPKKTDWDDSAL